MAKITFKLPEKAGLVTLSKVKTRHGEVHVGQWIEDKENHHLRTAIVKKNKKGTEVEWYILIDNISDIGPQHIKEVAAGKRRIDLKTDKELAGILEDLNNWFKKKYDQARA